jgi:hypothetical protein
MTKTNENTSRNQLICKLYFEEDKSTYAISDILREQHSVRMGQPNVFRVIKRDARKYGYIYPKA